MNIELPKDFDFYSRLLIIGSGVIALIIQLREMFSESREKSNLKNDLEILDLSEKSGLEEVALIKERIKRQVSSIYNHELRKENRASNFMVGLVVFVGFGLWSADLFSISYPHFNPWIILTLLCSTTGLSMVLIRNANNKKTEPFIKIGVYDKDNLRWGTIIFFTCGIILTYLILTYDHFTFGMFLSGLFCFISLMTFIRNVKRLN